MLARFFKLSALVLNFIEQPHVLDGYARLIGEGLCQFDLPVGKSPHGKSHQHNRADWIAFAQHRNGQNCAESKFSLHFLKRIIRVSHYIQNLNRLALKQRAAENGPSSCLERYPI